MTYFVWATLVVALVELGFMLRRDSDLAAPFWIRVALSAWAIWLLAAH